MTEQISAIITYTIFVSTVFGTVFGAVFYIPYRIEKPKKILRQLKYLSGRSSNDGCITLSVKTRNGNYIDVEYSNHVWQCDHTKVDILLVNRFSRSSLVNHCHRYLFSLYCWYPSWF